MKYITCFFGLICIISVQCLPQPLIPMDSVINIAEPYDDPVVQAILQSAFLQTTGVLYQFGTDILEPLKEFFDIITKSMETMADKEIPTKIGKAYLNALETGKKVKNVLLLSDTKSDPPSANILNKVQEILAEYDLLSNTNLANKIINNILNQ